MNRAEPSFDPSTYIDHFGYQSLHGTHVTATLVRVDRRLGPPRWEVRVVNRGAIIFELKTPMVFGTERAARQYLADIKAGLARPVV